MSTVRRSLLFTVADSYLLLVLQIASTVIIARILTPAEVGIFAVAAVFSGLASIFRDFGVAEYMIQEKELTRDRIASALTLNILVSWSMAAAMAVGAPLAGRFYGNEGITHVMWVQALNFVLVPFGAVTMAYFRRELNFQPVVVCNVLGSITSFVVSVGMALAGFGYMSLAWASLAGIVATVGAALFYRPAHFPTWPGFAEVGRVFDFSKFASSMYIVGQMGKGAPEMVIGRALGVVDVAMFSRANGLVEMFNRLVLRPVWYVCTPYFARSDREEGSMVAPYRTSISYLTAVGWPFLAFMAMASFSAVRLIYGHQWDPAVPLAQVLCVGCMLEIVHTFSREALVAGGQVRRANTLQFGLVVLQVLGLGAVLPFGLIGAAWGVLGASAAGLLLSQWHLQKAIGLSTADLFRACLPSAGLTVGSVAPAALWIVAEGGVTSHNYLRLGVGGGVLTAAAWVGCLYLLRHPLRLELSRLFGNLRGRFPAARAN